MKKRFGLLGVLCVAALFIAMFAQAGSPVTPATAAWTNVRDKATAYISAVEYAEGSSLLATGCVLYADSETNTIQTMTNVTIVARIGRTATNIAYNGVVMDEAAGTWYATLVVPSGTDIQNSRTTIEVTITDENTNIYVYLPVWIHTRTVLE